MQADPSLGEKLGFDALQRTESSASVSSTKRRNWRFFAHAVKPRAFFVLFLCPTCLLSFFPNFFLNYLASYSNCQDWWQNCSSREPNFWKKIKAYCNMERHTEWHWTSYKIFATHLRRMECEMLYILM